MCDRYLVHGTFFTFFCITGIVVRITGLLLHITGIVVGTLYCGMYHRCCAVRITGIVVRIILCHIVCIRIADHSLCITFSFSLYQQSFCKDGKSTMCCRYFVHSTFSLFVSPILWYISPVSYNVSPDIYYVHCFVILFADVLCHRYFVNNTFSF
jgi:hypothetical protein